MFQEEECGRLLGSPEEPEPWPVACGLWLSVCSAICEDLGLGLALPGALAHALPLAWLLAFLALPGLLLTPSPCHQFLSRCLCFCGGVFAIYRFLVCCVFAAQLGCLHVCSDVCKPVRFFVCLIVCLCLCFLICLRLISLVFFCPSG